jgi:thiol-disulfide isomerase/thioredoxin
MKLFFFFLFLFGIHNSGFSESISFTKSLEESKQKDKPILVDFYTSWCNYCKVLKEKVFPDLSLQADLDKFIILRINGEENSELVTKYNIKAYPTILFLDKSGYILDKLVGLPSTELLLQKLKSSYENKNIESILVQKQNKSPEFFEPNFSLANFYYSNSNFKSSSEFYRNAFNSKEENSPKKSESLFLLGISLMQEKKFSESSSVLQLFLEMFPAKKEDKIFFCLGVSYFFEGKKKEAKEVLLKAKNFSKTNQELEMIQEFLDQI